MPREGFFFPRRVAPPLFSFSFFSPFSVSPASRCSLQASPSVPPRRAGALFWSAKKL